MLVTKILETRLDINNINDIYCADYNKNILSILNDKYKGRCYKSIYVLEVLKIIRRSDLMCKNKVLDGSLYMDVVFEVNGIVYEKGDIIQNCNIVKINRDGTMHAKCKYASVYIKGVQSMIFEAGDKIPIIVNIVRYSIFDTEISISAIPLAPVVKEPTVYRINDTNSNKYVELFDFEKLEQLKEAINKKSKSSVFKFFRDLLYPYKSIKKDTYGNKYKITLDNLNKLNSGDLLYRPDLYINDDTYTLLKPSEVSSIKKDISILDITKSDYIIYLLNEYSKKLNHFLDFLENYDTVEKIKNSDSIWKLYNSLKT